VRALFDEFWVPRSPPKAPFIPFRRSPNGMPLEATKYAISQRKSSARAYGFFARTLVRSYVDFFNVGPGHRGAPAVGPSVPSRAFRRFAPQWAPLRPSSPLGLSSPRSPLLRPPPLTAQPASVAFPCGRKCHFYGRTVHASGARK